MQPVGLKGKTIEVHIELSPRINFHAFGRFVLICSAYEDFFNDTKSAVQEMSALRDVDNNIKAILVSTADITNIMGDSGICIVTDVEADINHMVDVIANYTCKLLHYHLDLVLLLPMGGYHFFVFY